MHILRFASPGVAARWPVPIPSAIDWRPVASGYEAEIELPPLAPGDIVVPSVAMLDGEHRLDVRIEHDGQSWSLAPLDRSTACATDPAPRLRTHVDYFSAHEPITSARLRCLVDATRTPLQYLLSVSIRPERVTPRSGRRSTPRLTVPAMSQLTAPRALRRRICSPTCVAMVLQYVGRDASLAAAVTECFHPATGMYGVWPLAIRAAARRGVIGCITSIDDLDAVAPHLEAGMPVVASIRFDAGRLPGAPLAHTDGHLVVVTGLDRDVVHVNDPASPRLEDVPRSYDRAAFAAAWLESRGAAYLFGQPA
jgi:uncharacterized protein YvpB